MDRRLATAASIVLAGAIGLLGRRKLQDIPSTEASPAIQEVANAPATSMRMPLGEDHPVAKIEDVQTASPTLDESSIVRSTLKIAPTAPPDRPLGDVLCDLVRPYPLDAGKRLDLRLAIQEVAQAIENGSLAEGTVILDFEWFADPGVIMAMSISILMTREYARINLSDRQGILRSPELDVYIRGGDVRVIPDATAKTVDVEERRSDAVVTKAKLKAMSNGITIHPGDAAGVLRRCRIVGSPFQQT